MKSRLNIGVIGLGRLGRVYAADLAHRVPNARLVAVADKQAGLAETFAREYGVPQWYQSHQELIGDKAIDAVAVITSTSTHREVVIDAAQGGKAIFCEKPISISLGEAEEMLTVVQATGVFFQMGFQRRFDAGYVAARRKVEAGVIGTPVLLTSTSRDPYRPPLEFCDPRVSGGLIADMGIHDFDVARMFMGEVSSVYAIGGTLAYPEMKAVGDIDNAIVNMVFENGTLGVVHLSRNAVFGYDIRAEVWGTQGSLQIGYFRETPILVMTKEGITHDVVPHFMERFERAYLVQIQDFVDHVLEGREPSITGADGLAALRVSLAASKSLRENRPVQVSEMYRRLMTQLVRWIATGEDKPLLRDREQIDRLYRRNRISIMLAITVGYGIAYTCRLGLSVVKKPLIDGGIFSAEQLGVIGSAMFYGYAFGKLVNGVLADHANMKKFLGAGVLLSALINIAMGWSTLLWVWVVLWAFNGWFQGFGAPGGIVALSQWFSNRERGRYYGIWSTAHSLGEGLTFVGSAALVVYFGWQGAFVGPGILCVAVALGVYALTEDRPQTLGLPAVADWKDDHAAGPGQGAGKAQRTWQTQVSILKSPSIWVLAFASAGMYMTRYGMNSWGMLYLQEAKGYSDLEAGGLLALNPLAGLAGCAAYGFISDKLFAARRPPVNLICALLEILALVILFFSPPGHPVLLSVAFLMYGFSINGLVTSLGGLFAVDIAPKKAAGAVMGFIGVFSYVGAAIQERISGVLIREGTTIVNGVRQYDFHAAVVFWLGTSILSLILAASLWRAKTSD